jgi:dCMP deaminase
VNPHTKLVVGLGYNGFPRGVVDSEERLSTRELKYKYVVHAEVNAILMAGERARGASLYVYPSFSTPPACHECTKILIQAGVREIVGYKPDEKDFERWQESMKITRSMCDEAGVTYRSVE